MLTWIQMKNTVGGKGTKSKLNAVGQPSLKAEDVRTGTEESSLYYYPFFLFLPIRPSLILSSYLVRR